MYYLIRMKPAPQSYQRYPLNELLGTPANVRLIRELARHGGQLSAPRLARATGLTPAAVRLSLEGLAGQALVSVAGGERGRLYRLHDGHPLHDALTTLFGSEAKLWERLCAELRSGVGSHTSIAAAWLYGSTARGEDRPDSDIDVLLAVDGEPAERVAEEVREAVYPLEQRYSATISVSALPVADIVARAARDDPFWTAIVADGWALKGEPPESFVARSSRALRP